MPASPYEIEEVLKENINIIYQTNILKIKEKEIELIKTELINDDNNRKKPINIEGTEYNYKCDYLIKALGSQPSNIINKLGLELDEKGYIKVDNYQTSNKKVFAGGDIKKKKKTVSSAARDGRESANAIAVPEGASNF